MCAGQRPLRLNLPLLDGCARRSVSARTEPAALVSVDTEAVADDDGDEWHHLVGREDLGYFDAPLRSPPSDNDPVDLGPRGGLMPLLDHRPQRILFLSTGRKIYYAAVRTEGGWHPLRRIFKRKREAEAYGRRAVARCGK